MAGFFINFQEEKNHSRKIRAFCKNKMYFIRKNPVFKAEKMNEWANEKTASNGKNENDAKNFIGFLWPF